MQIPGVFLFPSGENFALAGPVSRQFLIFPKKKNKKGTFKEKILLFLFKFQQTIFEIFCAERID